MNELSATLTILTTMVTPVVLILASGQLVLTTSQRLSRVIDRSRKLSNELEASSANGKQEHVLFTEKQHLLFDQLRRAVKRSRLLQMALATLYIALSLFVGTSIFLALIAITDLDFAWLPILMGLIGTALLFFASITLVIESRAALAAVSREMKFAVKLGEEFMLNTDKEMQQKKAGSE